MSPRFFSPFKDLFPKPKEIYVSESLTATPMAMAPDAFAEKIGFTWQESVGMAESVKEQSKTIQYENAILENELQAIANSVKKHRASLCIKYINDEVEYGVFARKDIPSGVYITCYGGELLLDKNLINPTLSRGLKVKHQDSFPIILEATQYRDMGAYIQHAPNSLKNYKVAGDFTNTKITLSNVSYVQASYNGYPLTLIKTDKAIKKGMPILVNYKETYWMASQKHPRLFLKDGSLLSTQEYRHMARRLVLDLNNNESVVLSEDNPLNAISPQDISNLLPYFLFKMGQGNGVIKFHKEVLIAAYQEAPYSPFIFVHLNSEHCIPDDKLSEEDKEMIRDYSLKKMQSPQDNVQTLPQQDEKPSNLLGFNLHSNEPKKQIEAELCRICECLEKPTIGYVAAKQTAYIKSSTQAENAQMEMLRTHLSSSFEIKFGHDPKTHVKLMYIIKPNVTELKAIAALPLPAKHHQRHDLRA